MNFEQFGKRKREHIRHALDPRHQALGHTRLDQVHLVHEALPELDFKQVDISSIGIGQKTRVPFFVAGMTAGHEDAPRINRVLAMGCQARGWSMGVGSQRLELHDLAGSAVDHWKRLRDEVPELVLFANLGISQLIHAPLARVRALVDSIQAQALVVHANALQEVIQVEGTPDFRGATSALKKVCGELGVPVVLKETGCGFSLPTLLRLRETGLAAVDVSGLGGTHWGRIEGSRARETGSPVHAQAAETFAEWGEPTVDSVIAAREAFAGSPIEIWATGGVRTGLDAAKLISLGATQVGFAKPALEAALAGPEALELWMETREFELKTALFCTGSASVTELKELRTGYGKQA